MCFKKRTVESLQDGRKEKFAFLAAPWKETKKGDRQLLTKVVEKTKVGWGGEFSGI